MCVYVYRFSSPQTCTYNFIAKADKNGDTHKRTRYCCDRLVLKKKKNSEVTADKGKRKGREREKRE